MSPEEELAKVRSNFSAYIENTNKLIDELRTDRKLPVGFDSLREEIKALKKQYWDASRIIARQRAELAALQAKAESAEDVLAKVRQAHSFIDRQAPDC